MNVYLLQLIFALVTLPFLQLGYAQLLDHTSSGHYQIRNCNAGRTGSKASALQALLPRIYNTLQTVIADAALGHSSIHGFESFFHGDENIPYVQSIFKKIAAGDPVPLSTQGRVTNPLLNLGYPTIVCLQPGYQDTAGLYAGCNDNPGVSAAIQDHYVVLCPLFWEQESRAESFNCPRVRRNTLTPNDNDLIRNQEADLVHELAHIYGVDPGTRWQDGIYETYRVRDATNLDEESALKNAPNFAYYYAGK